MGLSEGIHSVMLIPAEVRGIVWHEILEAPEITGFLRNGYTTIIPLVSVAATLHVIQFNSLVIAAKAHARSMH